MRTTYKIIIMALRGLIALAPPATSPASQPLVPSPSPSKNRIAALQFQNMLLEIELVIELLGRERIMFGTDYPFGSYKRQVEQVMLATEGDPKLRNLVFFENANRLLHIV